MIDIDSRLWIARSIGKAKTEAHVEVFRKLKGRGRPDAPPTTISDGWSGIDEAMIEVYGVVPEYQGIGRSPTRNQPQSGWQHLQVVKQRENGRVVGIELHVIYGDKILALLGKSSAYIERTYLAMHLFNGRPTRRTLAFSKLLEMYRASATWEDLVYNLARPLKTLQVEILGDPTRRWQPRTPAMAAGLTDHIWTVKELSTAGVPP